MSDSDIPMSEEYATASSGGEDSNSQPGPSQPTRGAASVADASQNQSTFMLHNPFAASPTQQTPFLAQSTPFQIRQAPFATPSTPSRQSRIAASSTSRLAASSTIRQDIYAGPNDKGKRRALEEPSTPGPLQDFIDTAQQHFTSQNEQWSTVADKMHQASVALERNADVLDRLVTVLDLNNERLAGLERKEEREKARKKATEQMGTEQGSSNRDEQRRKERVSSNQSEENKDDADDEFDDSPSPSSPQCQKPGVKSKAKKKAPSEQLLQREYVRNWLKMLIGEFTDPLENKVSQAEAKAFEQEFATDPLKRPCTIDDFRYFLDGGPRSAWNIGASYVLLDFIEQKRLIDVSTSIARGVVREAFLARIKTLRGEYLKLAKSAETQALKNQYNRKYQRKYSLFHQRRAILESLTGLQRFLVYYDRLGIESISSDEEDTSMGKDRIQFKVTNPPWRNTHVGQFYRKLDWCHLESRLVRDGLLGPHFGKGAPPRVREYTAQASTSQSYVRGLPYNFYDATWLENQESGWFNGGRGLVNEIICPSRDKVDLKFPKQLEDALKRYGYQA